MIQKVIELRQRGLSIREIAKQLGVSHTTVWRYLKKWEEQKTGQGVTSRDVSVTSHRGDSNAISSDNSTAPGLGIDLSLVMSQVQLLAEAVKTLQKQVSELQPLVLGTVEHLKSLDRNMTQILQELEQLKTFRDLVLTIARLRVEGPTKCKHLNDYGYCEKILLEYCPPEIHCVEVVTESGMRLYRPKVTQNPIICTTCPWYTPRKK